MAKKNALREGLKDQFTDFDPGKLYTAPVAAPQPVKKETEAAGILGPVTYEKRTRRVQFVFNPTLYEQAQQRYVQLGIRSMNDYIHRLVEADLREGR